MPERNERRSYFRLDDVLMLHYRVLGSDDSQQTAALASAPQVRTTSILAQIEHEFGESLRHLWQAQPETARALGLLNRKLSVIAQSLNGAGGVPDYAEAQVNISGGGIAFDSEEALEPGTRLALRLMLKPSQEELMLTGRVVSCEPLTGGDEDEGAHWWLRVDFENCPDEQERLIQHIIQLQSIRISERRVR